MPKEKQSVSSRLKNIVREFGENTFATDASVLLCKFCNIKINYEKKFNVTQHLKTEKHIKAVRRAEIQGEKKKQQLVTNSTKKSSFSKDLCFALLSANIPLHKVSNQSFRTFLEVYTGHNVPTETNLRLGYIDDIFDEKMSKIKLELSGKKVWVSIDETIDIEGRFVANVIVGILEADYPGKQYLVHSEQLEKTNYSTICRVFDKSIGIIGIQHEDVLLFTSDAAPYMIKAGNTLKAFYSHMIHITCTAHGLHRVAEEVRGKFSNVDKLISSVKKIFRKAPNRVQLFKNEAPHLNLPPEPIITRWSTWIMASNYYCENIEIIRNILEKLDADDAVSIKEAKKYISKAGIERDLAYIKSNFTILTVSITKLQEQGLPLAEAINVFENVEKVFETLQGPIGKAVFNKLNNVVHKNVGLKILKNISNVLSGNNMNTELESGLPEDFSTDDLVYFKFAPITSVDIERSFSMYKTLLSNNRRSFHFENLYKHLIIQCNS